MFLTEVAEKFVRGQVQEADLPQLLSEIPTAHLRYEDEAERGYGDKYVDGHPNNDWNAALAVLWANNATVDQRTALYRAYQATR